MEDNTYSLIEENNEIKKGKLEQLLKHRWKKKNLFPYFHNKETNDLGRSTKNSRTYWSKS